MNVVDEVKQVARDELGLELDEYERKSDDGRIFFKLPYKIANGCDCDIYMIFDEDLRVVSYRVFSFVKLGEAYKEDELIKLVCHLNVEYRYVKFTIDFERMSVNAEIDQAIEPNGNMTELILGTVGRLSRIVDDAYPKFMKLIWR